jgi:two-component system, OmpR family, heavy metal sensor histidine kinase CusS
MLRSLSLTARLTVLFTTVAAAVVMGLGIVFVRAADRHFEELDRMALQDKLHLIESILLSSPTPAETRDRLAESLSHHHGLFALVQDQNGGELFRSTGFQPPSPATAPGTNAQSATLQAWHDTQREYRGLGISISLGEGSRDRLNAFVALDTVHHSNFRDELWRTLAIYAAAATVLIGFLGWLAAHQGLAPLRAMRSRAAVVSGTQIDERMPIEAVPIEMADLARELNRMLDRLQADFQRLSEFSSDLAHELRTPISNLLTQTQVALSSERDPDTYRDILASNAEEFQRLARMIADMLFLAKTERGAALPHQERFPVAQEVRALFDFYDAVAEGKDVSLVLAGDSQILGDRLMIRRALSNLLSNALRHTQARGVVQVDIAATPASTVVSVQNPGEDVDPALLSRLFDRFFRADSARSHPDTDGAGLGLSITRAIVEAHGGTVSVTSEGGLTRFTMTFPA